MEPKVALITGAARRIGAAIARTLHEAGYRVMIHYQHSQIDADALVRDLNALRPDSAAAFSCDLADLDSLPRLIEDTSSRWGRLDVLINNASRFYPTPIGSTTSLEWDDLMSSNIKGAFFLSQAALPILKRYQGQILNITDIHASKPMKQHTVYCMAKAALNMMTWSLAREAGPEVRVNAIAPGAIAWPEGESELTETIRNQIIQATALKRPGHPKNIAQAVLALLQNDFITGQILSVDGGRS